MRTTYLRRGALVALLCTAAAAGGRGRAQTRATCLQRLEGHWRGTGTSYGQQVRDAAVFEWTLGGRFLRVTYRAEQGDSFAAEGYLRQAAADSQVVFYEFSTGARPVRILNGTCSVGELRLDEYTGARHVRLAFRFVDASTVEMTETELHGEQADILVKEQLKRLAP